MTSAIVKEECTGRIRHRVEHRLIGCDLVVLQVEVTQTMHYWDAFDDKTDTTIIWRDARVEDLTTIEATI